MLELGDAAAWMPALQYLDLSDNTDLFRTATSGETHTLLYGNLLTSFRDNLDIKTSRVNPEIVASFITRVKET